MKKVFTVKLLGEHMKRRIRPDEINVSENPDETGSFYIGFQFDNYVMSPDGKIQSDST